MNPPTRSTVRQGRIALGGGGGAAESRLIDETYAEWVGGGHLLYLPLALSVERHDDATAWLRSVFEPLGIRRNPGVSAGRQLEGGGLPSTALTLADTVNLMSSRLTMAMPRRFRSLA